MWMQLLTIDEVNTLPSEHFIKIFGNVVEHCPAAAIGILKKRPFGSVEDISKAITEYLDSLKPEEKEQILQLYPDSVNKLTDLSNLMLEFNTHQKIISSKNIRFEEKKKLRRLNNHYREKFGFPFILCTKEKDIDQVFSKLESRLSNEKQKEIETAIEEVKKIGKLRICEIVK